jgi:hypothetical protein
VISLLLSLATAADLEVDSAVTRAVVYRDRARVTREVAIDVPAGRTDLIFDGLPIQVIRESLAADGEGTAGATLLGIDMRPRRGTEDRDAKVAALQKERLVLADKISDQSDIVARVAADLVFLRGISPKAPAKLTEATFLADDAPQQLAAMSRQLGERTAALLAEQRTAERAQREVRKELDRVDRELAQLARSGNEDSLRVAVGLDAKRAGKVTVRLDYVVTGASWSPHYDARYDLAGGKVRLDLSGNVVQRTGEDWTGVALVLSTARPQQGTAPPVLVPFTLGQGGGVASSGSSSSRAAAFEFVVRGKEDVAADGSSRRVPLTRLDLTGEVVHRVVPRRLEAAWLTAKVENTADYALLAGPVSAYLGSAYVGDGALAQTAPGGELMLSFGVDDRVQVDRDRLDVTAAEGKGLGNRDRQSWAFETTVKNGTGLPLNLVVVEQVPVSNEDTWQVKVEVDPSVEIPKPGVFEWEVKLANKAEQAFRLEYEITWPKGDPPVFME